MAYLQRRLADLGFYDGPMDGWYGELTEAAVRSFQRSFRLAVDGLAGRQVLGLLADPLVAVETHPVGGNGSHVTLREAARLLELAPGALEVDNGLFHGAPLPKGRPIQVRRRLAIVWDEGLPGRQPGEEGSSPWSGRACPWTTWEVDRLGRIRPARDGAAPVERLSSSPGCPIAIAILEPGRSLLPPRPGTLARWLARAERPPRVILTGPPQSEHLPLGPGSRPLPTGAAVRVGKGLRLAGVRPWLSRPVTGGSRALVRWEGSELGRLGSVWERIVLWAPLPGAPPEQAFESVRAFVQGLRPFRPPWAVLLGIDLATWLIEGDQRRRLTRTEAVMLNWQLRVRRLTRRHPSEPDASSAGQARLVRYGAAQLARWMWWMRWAGLGGVALAGVDRAEPASLAAIQNALAAVKLGPSPS
ncbi:MAG: peptidoglycan-binding protein [Limnochordaceae bacterium]|nr:peptidoglycan-binding protein [Limnochordaceae bacterium]